MTDNNSNTSGYLHVDHVKYISDAINYMNFDKPILVEKGCSDMDAISKWSPEYLKNVLDDTIVNVEVYDSKDHMGMTKFKSSKQIEFNKYMHKMLGYGPPYYYFAEQSLRNIIDVNDSQTSIVLQDIKNDFDHLREPIEELLFLGKDTRSGCHLHVVGDYMLNQIFGEKTVYLFDLDEHKDIPMNAFWDENSNFTKFNLFDIDHSKLKIYKVVLKPGNSLLIPPWWFHAVEGHGYSCSITKIYDRSDMTYLYRYRYLLFLSLLDIVEEGIPYLTTAIVVYFMWVKFRIR